MRRLFIMLLLLSLGACTDKSSRFQEEQFTIDPPNRAPSAERAAPTRDDIRRAAGVVAELIEKAKGGDRAYFAPLVQAPADSQAVTDMMRMIRHADMLQRFQHRMYFVPATKLPLRPGHWRLDFHDPELNVHIQVDLMSETDPWRVNRLYFCR